MISVIHLGCGSRKILPSPPLEKEGTKAISSLPELFDDFDRFPRGSFRFQRGIGNSRNHLGDATIQTVIEEGDFADSILKTAKRVHADLIVMGSHSRKWLESIVMGSVTEEVLHQTTIPLYIVPTKKRG